MSKNSGSLFIISAPSGGGKTSLVRELVSKLDNITISVSHTTRPKRSDEKDGVNYHFIDEATFKQMAEDSAFLEHATVFGNYYGTSQQWVEEQLAAGTDVILELDWQGAQQIRKIFSDKAVSIYILPPSIEVLEKRLRDRNQDSVQSIEKRLQNAKNEMSHYLEYDYLIVNDVFEHALSQLHSIVVAHRLFTTVQQKSLDNLLGKLLD